MGPYEVDIGLYMGLSTFSSNSMYSTITIIDAHILSEIGPFFPPWEVMGLNPGCILVVIWMQNYKFGKFLWFMAIIYIKCHHVRLLVLGTGVDLHLIIWSSEQCKAHHIEK